MFVPRLDDSKDQLVYWWVYEGKQTATEKRKKNGVISTSVPFLSSCSNFENMHCAKMSWISKAAIAALRGLLDLTAAFLQVWYVNC